MPDERLDSHDRPCRRRRCNPLGVAHAARRASAMWRVALERFRQHTSPPSRCKSTRGGNL